MSFQKVQNLKVVFNYKNAFFSKIYNSVHYSHLFSTKKCKNIGIKEFGLTSIITLVQQSSSKAHMHINVKKNIIIHV